MSEEKSSPQGNQEVVAGTPPNAEPERALTEVWWDSPIPNRLTAAYQVGRLLNQLNWHFQHLLFFRAHDHRQYPDEVLGRLSGLSYKFVSVPSNSLDDAIRSVRDDWRDWLRCEVAVDEVAECSDEQWSSSKERRQDLVATRIRRPLLEKLREAFRKELDEDEKWALELGDCVDQGVRRSDISNYFEEQVTLREPKTPAESDEGCSALDRLLIEERHWPVFEPGDLEVDTAWPHRLNALLQKLTIAIAQDFRTAAGRVFTPQ